MPVETEKPDSSQVLQTKAEIQAAFLQLLKKKKIEQISIREITDLVHLNRTSFYRYYLDIYDLQQNILDNFLAQIQQKISDVFYKILVHGAISPDEIPLEFIIEHQKILQLLLRDPASIEHLKQEQKKYFKQQLQIADGDQQADYALEFLLSGQIGLLAYWMENQDKLPLDELFQLTKELLIRPLLTLASDTWLEHPTP